MIFLVCFFFSFFPFSNWQSHTMSMLGSLQRLEAFCFGNNHLQGMSKQTPLGDWASEPTDLEELPLQIHLGKGLSMASCWSLKVLYQIESKDSCNYTCKPRLSTEKKKEVAIIYHVFQAYSLFPSPIARWVTFLTAWHSVCHFLWSNSISQMWQGGNY